MSQPNEPRRPEGAGRPLDDREAAEFARIVECYKRDAGSSLATAGRAPTRAERSDHPLTWRMVLLVLAAAASFAVTSARLPHPLNLWSPVLVLAAVAIACAVWGRLREQRRTGDKDR